MKIALWTEFYPPYRGGIERAVQLLARGFADRGDEISVITSHGDLPLPDIERQGSISIYRFPFHEALGKSDLKTIVRTISNVAALKQELQPDLIHLHLQAPSAFFHVKTLEAWASPVVVTIHGEFKDCTAGEGTLLGTVLDRADWVTAVSRAMLNDLHAIAPATVSKSSVIYNGHQIERQSRPVAQQEHIILGCGRLVRDKGFDLLLEAFHGLLEQIPAARLVFTSTGVEEEALKRRAQELGIADHVTFCGWVADEELFQWMSCATMMVLPSRWREGFGLVVVEAALSRLPVIATKVGALPELIAHDRTGILVPPEDTKALRDAMIGLILSPDKGRQIAEAAYRAAKIRFNPATIFDQYEAVYLRLLSVPNSHRERTEMHVAIQ